ncbi:MAG: alpha/beta hydrolase, partial [Deltaproteobacteria bacterium]|nr:alpha/beta hydrolase [Deltaproteobacteria bacterium]
MNRLMRMSIALVVLSLLCGCALLHLRKDNAFSKNNCLITGNIYAAQRVHKPILVVAFRTDDRLTVAHHTVLHESGPYVLLVPRGTYRVFAFEDKNQNLVLDQDELAGVALGDEADFTIDARPGGWVDSMVIILSRNQAASYNLPADILARNAAGTFSWRSTQPGAIMDLDDPAFGAEQGVRGFWSPLEFFRDFGANIYFLEPYDPQKIPVLLVHGAAGSPQDWRYFIRNLNRSRYQPWIYYYPSGARLKASAELLGMAISELHRKYNFENLYVTAHSMGGHVARYTLAHSSVHREYTRLFVSISTPFGGEELAGAGVKNSPAVIPSWKDMTPDSDFIKFSFSREMPPTIKHYLFFGHRGGRNPLRPNNDTTVTLASMLDARAQADALKVLGFNEDHVGILNSADVLSQYKKILESVDQEIAAAARQNPKGKIRFRYVLKEQSDVGPLWMILMAVSADKNAAVFRWFPDPLKPVQEMGPIPAGAYEIGLFAWGYKADPRTVRTDVSADRVADVALSM